MTVPHFLQWYQVLQTGFQSPASFWRIVLAGVTGLGGITALIVGGWFLWQAAPFFSRTAVGSLGGSATGQLDWEEPDQVSAQAFVVEVSGAVRNPGLYRVDSDARVGDAIVQAGGWADTADHSQIAAEINLAQPLTDGQKIYIPILGDERTPFETEAVLIPGSEAGLGEALVSINTATLAELEALPGIGAKRAQTIIENRPYASLDDLVVKKALSTTLLSDLQNTLTL